MNLSEEVASAVSTGAIPGCTGDVVEVLLCITGTSPAEVLGPSLMALPDQLPYGGTESVHLLMFSQRFRRGDSSQQPTLHRVWRESPRVLLKPLAETRRPI